MVQRPLRNMVVVGAEVVGQRGLQLSRRGEAGLLADLADAAIEPLHHAIGLGVSGRGQTVLNTLRDALLVKQMFTRGLFFFAGEAVGELRAVVGQYLGDLEGCNLA